MVTPVKVLKMKEPAAPGTWWCFRNTVTLEELPRSLELRLAAEIGRAHV